MKYSHVCLLHCACKHTHSRKNMSLFFESTISDVLSVVDDLSMQSSNVYRSVHSRCCLNAAYITIALHLCGKKLKMAPAFPIHVIKIITFHGTQKAKHDSFDKTIVHKAITSSIKRSCFRVARRCGDTVGIRTTHQ